MDGQQYSLGCFGIETEIKRQELKLTIIVKCFYISERADPIFFVLLIELLGEEEILQRVRRGVLKM